MQLSVSQSRSDERVRKLLSKDLQMILFKLETDLEYDPPLIKSEIDNCTNSLEKYF